MTNRISKGHLRSYRQDWTVQHIHRPMSMSELPESEVGETCELRTQIYDQTQPNSKYSRFICKRQELRSFH